MSTPPEEVAAPAGDAVLFRSSPLRTFAAVLVIVAAAYLLVTPLVNRLVGGDGDLLATAVQAGIAGVLVGGGFALSARSSLPTWVRVSAAGLELAAQGSDPVLLAWPDIRGVVVRRTLTRTVLEVTPVDLDRVHPVDGEGPGWPTMTDTDAGAAFTADLTQVWPGPRALRRELARRMHGDGSARTRPA